MKRLATGLLLLALMAGPAAAETRFWAYDAADRVTQALTKGITIEIRRNFFGAISVQRLFSTSARGSAEIRRGGPTATRAALPAGVRANDIYAIRQEGDGRGLVRALCPGADDAWLLTGRIRQGDPITLYAVGRWTDGTYRHCVTLSYSYRGEWTLPEGATPQPDETSPSAR